MSQVFRVLSVVACGLATVGGLTLSSGALALTAEKAAGAAKATVEKRASPQSKWLGPTTGPTAEPGKRIVYISIGENNPIGHLWGGYLQDAAKSIDWEVTVLDGKSSPAEWVNTAKQAVALKPDGIVTSSDAKTMQEPLAQANELQIPIVGLHGAAEPGPHPDDYLFTNIVSDPVEIGRAMVEWAVASPKGSGAASWP